MIFEIITCITIFLLVFASAFAMYLPLCAITKDRLIGLRFAIPFSISVEIIIGYVFYCTNYVKYFPIVYLVIIFLANVWAYFKLKPVVIQKPKIDIPTGLSLLVVIFAIVYTRYFDAFNFIGPGGNDTFSHYYFVKNLLDSGSLSNGYYAPGFHLFMLPIARVAHLSDLYRFAGPAVGIVTIISITLLIKDLLKNKIILFFLPALLVLPIYNQLTLQTISFFSSSLSFIYLTAFIVIASQQSSEKSRIPIVLFFVFSVALALTIPYFFIILMPSFFILYIVFLLLKKTFGKEYFRYIGQLTVILVIGFLISCGHVFIQSKILNRYSGFPEIPVASSDSSGSEMIASSSDLSAKYHLPKFIAENRFLNPMIGTGLDLVAIKNIRPINSVLGLGAYLWVAFAIFLFCYALRKKDPTLLIISTFSIFFGLCTQTGIFEMSFYRGRSGWYLLLLSILGIVFFADKLFRRGMTRWLLLVCIAASVAGVVIPPKFYRSYYEDEFVAIKEIANDSPNTPITVIANNDKLGIVADNVVLKYMEVQNLASSLDSFVVIEKKYFLPSPSLSQGATSFDKNFSEYFKQQTILKEVFEQQKSLILNSPEFKKYKLFKEYEEFDIYKTDGTVL